MKHTSIRGCDFSVLSLGTVQLGMPYGLNKAAGKPDQLCANQVLNQALNSGVNWIDTAAAYGDAETVLGHWLSNIEAYRQPNIATKVNALDHSSLSALRFSLRLQLEDCKKRLGRGVSGRSGAYAYCV